MSTSSTNTRQVYDYSAGMIEILRPYGIRELAQTGLVALARGRHTIEDAYLSVVREEAEIDQAG